MYLNGSSSFIVLLAGIWRGFWGGCMIVAEAFQLVNSVPMYLFMARA